MGCRRRGEERAEARERGRGGLHNLGSSLGHRVLVLSATFWGTNAGGPTDQLPKNQKSHKNQKLDLKKARRRRANFRGTTRVKDAARRGSQISEL